MKKITLSIVLLCLFGALVAKIPLGEQSRSRAAGYISAKVEVILQMVSFSLEQRRAMLEVEHRNMLALGLDKTEPELLKKIEAYLGITRIQREHMTVIGDEMEKVKDDNASIEAFITYAKEIISAAAAYSDVVDVPGIPSLSQQRELSIVELAKTAFGNASIRDSFQYTLRLHRQLASFVKKSATLRNFVDSFVHAVVKKHQARKEGMVEEILFRALDILVDVSPHDARTVAHVVDDFLPRFNRYVVKNQELTVDELQVPYSGWAELILESSRTESHMLLLLSFAMEMVKQQIRDEVVFVQQKEFLKDKTAEAVESLRKEGVPFSEDKIDHPLYIGSQCASYASSLLTKRASQQHEVSAQKKELARQFSQLAQDINQLASDYETIALRQSDNRSVLRIKEMNEQLSFSEKEVLGISVDGIDPVSAKLSSVQHDLTKKMVLQSEEPKKPSFNKAIPLLVTSGVLIAWEVMGRTAEKKKEKLGSGEELGMFWSFFDHIGAPTRHGEKALDRMKKLFAKDKKDVTPVPVKEELVVAAV